VFDPIGFLHLADELAIESARSNAVTRAARIRTAYGRLYYGLFLAIREAIVGRHGVPARRIEHGALISHLQHSMLDGAVRKLGRELQKLYGLRRHADYELAPAPHVRAQLEDPASARILAREAIAFARQIPHMDFAPIAHLFSLR
jgi:hypothetical protein